MMMTSTATVTSISTSVTPRRVAAGRELRTHGWCHGKPHLMTVNCWGITLITKGESKAAFKTTGVPAALRTVRACSVRSTYTTIDRSAGTLISCTDRRSPAAPSAPGTRNTAAPAGCPTHRC